MNFADLVGHTLDEKYRIERQLGRGGMGTVYLATHLGTERPVAVKVIAPQFMERPEFVERFRREAKAAGRLRHPNVVDVTDFGFAETGLGQVAYLVMEYLDGCTLGEILEEEKNLPVGWTLDILEQVCSAVHEAHTQGIIHRDLKPDNIWLEPNQRGGYTVKVLDFGIAKLETTTGNGSDDSIHLTPPLPTIAEDARLTAADNITDDTLADSMLPTLISESRTAAETNDAATAGSELPAKTISVSEQEAGTAIMPVAADITPNQDGVRTRIISPESGSVSSEPAMSRGFADTTSSLASSELTRAGSVLGTPLYMSPEQCRGEKLDARSDVYSLGVIAYQMLSGSPPFTGDFSRVMEAHREKPPPPLKVKKVRRKLKGVIQSALAKDPADRPQTAEAFASRLRSRSEGIAGLLRRSGMIYTEHISKFVLLSALFHIPMVILTTILIVSSFLKASELVSNTTGNIALGISGTGLSIITAFCATLITGTTSWIVIHSLAVPLRPIRIRASLKEAKKKWKRFAGAGILTTVVAIMIAVVGCGITFATLLLAFWAIIGVSQITAGIAISIAIIVGIVGFVGASVAFILTVPVVMMEGATVVKALLRSVQLVKRSAATSFAAILLMFLIPAVFAGIVSFSVNMTARALDPESRKPPVQNETSETAESGTNAIEKTVGNGEKEISISFGDKRVITNKPEQKDIRARVKDTLLETLTQILLLPLQIFATSFTAIIVALLYLKTRQAGGESLKDLLDKFEETDQPRKKWQERVRQRLIQSGRTSITSKP